MARMPVMRSMACASAEGAVRGARRAPSRTAAAPAAAVTARSAAMDDVIAFKEERKEWGSFAYVIRFI